MAVRKPVTPQGMTANPAFSPGVQVGEFLFISGTVGNDATGNLVGVGDCEAQTRQVFANIKSIAAAVGASMDDVVKITWRVWAASGCYPLGFRRARKHRVGYNQRAS